MNVRLVAIATALATFAPAARAQEPPVPERARLKVHIDILASPEFAGRRDAGARKAEAYVMHALDELKLRPLFGDSFTQDIPGSKPGEVLGRNVGAAVTGSDPILKDEWVIISAHYDHLGTRNGVLYPGADDNASGVAMMLEVARCLAAGPTPPKRSVAFVGFDLEENGLWGSRHFVKAPPMPLEKIALFMTADMLGRALGGVCKEQLFIMGGEHAPELKAVVEEAARSKPVRVEQLGSDLLLIDRSDYGPFRARKVPYLFFSTGENPRYHTPEDTPETIDHPKVEAASRIAAEVLRSVASAPTRPTWRDRIEPSVEEATAVGEVLRVLLEHKDDLRIQRTVVAVMERQAARIDAIRTRGTMTATERTEMLRTAQLVLFTIL